MKKLFVIVAAFLVGVPGTHSQGVYIASGSNLFIRSGATVSLDSLVLKPSVNFNLTGLRREYRNSTVVHAFSRPYIRRVYHFSTTTPAFSGAISFYYRDAELNSITESTLTLNVHNGTAWNAYTTGVVRNSTTNYVTTSLSSIPLNELTLAGNAALLTTNKASGEQNVEPSIAVYPNPVHDLAVVHIAVPEPVTTRLQLYDSKGALLQTQQTALAKGNNQVKLNMQEYAKAIYILNVEWNNTNKIIPIIKQ